MRWLILAIALGCLALKIQTKCGYSSCNPVKKGHVNVHIIAHTHDDVGWIKTVDEYYYDTQERINGGVRAILNSSVEALLRDRKRRFIYVESAFLFKWWKEQTPATKALFKKLLNNGQLEIVGGAWSMNDEATTNYQSIIDQFTLGLSKLNETFGPCARPKVGWQIDSFGHSSEMASIFAQLGFDGLFLGRIDWNDKMERFRSRTAEMLWQGSLSLGRKSEIFTSVLYNTYWPPNGLCFDTTCYYQNISIHNIERKWFDLVETMDRQVQSYLTNNIILTMGGDFHYTNAELWFGNLDKLIQYGNAKQSSGSIYNLLYSTPSCYLKAVRDEAKTKKIVWPVKIGDFFPYAMERNAYWTGFYTSRPTLKRFERLGNNFLQICKQLHVLGNLNGTYRKKLNPMRKAMAIMQHHDAITGTEQEHVANDYAKMLSRGFHHCNYLTNKALNRLSRKINGTTRPNHSFKSCPLLNISDCGYVENKGAFLATIYNPLSRPIDHYVRIPVKNEKYMVLGPRGEKLGVQLIPIPNEILKIPGRRGKATQELIFVARRIPALGFKSYYVRRMIKPTTVKRVKTERASVFSRTSVAVSNETGLLVEVEMNGKKAFVRQNFFYHHGALHPRPSGAYIFQPLDSYALPFVKSVAFRVYRGPLVTEIHQAFNGWISQIVRLYRGENFVEFQWLVGPLPAARRSLEVISRFSSDLRSNGTFFTDSNGRELVERRRSISSTWGRSSGQFVSGNYYPVTSKILIRDAQRDVQLAVLTDRSQGGTSLRDGELELMIHRNSLFDDSLGVDEALSERAFGQPIVVRGSHYLVLEPYLNRTRVFEKDLAQRKLLDSWTFLSSTKGLSYQKYKKLYRLQYSGLKSPLPENVHILTLEPWSDDRILLRLEHTYAKGEGPRLSKSTKVNLKQLFSTFIVADVKEATLGTNRWLEQNRPLKFDARATSKGTFRNNRVDDKFVITLKPMQIRTFFVKISLKKRFAL